MKTQWHTPDEKPDKFYKGYFLRWKSGGYHFGGFFQPDTRKWYFRNGMEIKDMEFLHTKDYPQPTEAEFKLLDK